MNVVGTASPLSAEFLLPLIHSAWRLLPYSPCKNPLLYPLLGLHTVEFGKKLPANYKAKQAGIKPFEKPPASFGSIVAKRLRAKRLHQQSRTLATAPKTWSFLP